MSAGKKKHVNIPVFIPHLGCPNMCVFCNQRFISGVDEFKPSEARETIEAVLTSVNIEETECEIAFFGGSFTGIDRWLMISLLDLAEEYVRAGKVTGIRMSTRPDYIDEEIIDILKRYTISAVELGIQSFDERILSNSKRGHSPETSESAMIMLREAGLRTVGQMMIGLPGATPESERECARNICSLGAYGARIYPTIVFRGTELAQMTDRGDYTPLTVDEAVTRSADVLEIFESNGVECLRIGLCESENLHSDKSYYKGPNHPSLGELVYSELYRRKICTTLDSMPAIPANISITVPRGAVSKAAGQNRKNIIFIKENYGVKSVRFTEDGTLDEYDMIINTDDPIHKGERNCT